MSEIDPGQDLEHRETELQVTTRYLQDQFAVLLGINPEQLRGLKLCPNCLGIDYQWTDICFSNLAAEMMEELSFDFDEYRAQHADAACKACDASGFKNGNFSMTTDEWIELSQAGLSE
jgi:hypothetical protein